MNPLLNAKKGTLYNLDSTFLSEIRYERTSVETAVFIFPTKQEIPFPLTVFFMPDGGKYNHSSYQYTLTGPAAGHNENEDSDDYAVAGTTNDVPELRDELRINVSFQIDIQLDKENPHITAYITDISAGGFMFVSKTAFKSGDTISFIFPSMHEPVYVTAVVKRQRPANSPGLYGYGCQFVNLMPKAEASVRNFVFHEELIQRRKK